MAHRPHRPHNFRALSKPKLLHKHEHRHYWPYIPVLLLVLATFWLSLAQPIHKRGTLAYAVSMSTSDLLQATNSQRQQSGASGLQINSALAAAAQAKANDMVARNYWSHTTPDGQQPWVFMDNAGYKYQKAGENLAYGFPTSDDTVTGWMNSPPHRENMLDPAYTEVGFGFANGEDYNNSGQETVVVAMYGKPQVLAANNQPTVPAPPVPSQAKPAPETAAPAPETVATPEPAKPEPVTSDTLIISEPAALPVARIQTLTNGQAPWTLFGAGLIAGLAAAFLLIKHAAGLRHFIKDSERFVLHHPLMDTVLVSLVLAGSFLSQTTGFIR